MLKSETALLNVIDVQGRLAHIVSGSEAMRQNVVRLVEGAKLFDIPVVATEAGGIPEIIQSERDGLLVPVKNPPALAEAIICVSGQGACREGDSRHERRCMMRRD